MDVFLNCGHNHFCFSGTFPVITKWIKGLFRTNKQLLFCNFIRYILEYSFENAADTKQGEIRSEINNAGCWNRLKKSNQRRLLINSSFCCGLTGNEMRFSIKISHYYTNSR